MKNKNVFGNYKLEFYTDNLPTRVAKIINESSRVFITEYNKMVRLNKLKKILNKL